MPATYANLPEDTQGVVRSFLPGPSVVALYLAQGRPDLAALLIRTPEAAAELDDATRRQVMKSMPAEQFARLRQEVLTLERAPLGNPGMDPAVSAKVAARVLSGLSPDYCRGISYHQATNLLRGALRASIPDVAAQMYGHGVSLPDAMHRAVEADSVPMINLLGTKKVACNYHYHSIIAGQPLRAFAGTPLELAVWLNRPHLIAPLVKAGARLDAFERHCPSSVREVPPRDSALVFAVRNNHSSAIPALVNAGALSAVPGWPQPNIVELACSANANVETLSALRDAGTRVWRVRPEFWRNRPDSAEVGPLVSDMVIPLHTGIRNVVSHAWNRARSTAGQGLAWLAQTARPYSTQAASLLGTTPAPSTEGEQPFRTPARLPILAPAELDSNLVNHDRTTEPEWHQPFHAHMTTPAGDVAPAAATTPHQPPQTSSHSLRI